MPKPDPTALSCQSDKDWQNYLLSHIRIVMVNTTLPANIGSVARAMHTMGLQQLIVVEPKKPLDDDAIAHAAGGQHILETMQIVPTLADAIADCQWVFATSSRQRHIPKPVITPRQAAQMIVADAFGQSFQAFNQPLKKVAFVFGREDRGLTNEELRLADYHVQIPANPNYSVLNVAMAVQVIASVLYDAIETATIADSTNYQDQNANQLTMSLNIRQDWDEPAISHAQKQQLETRFLALLSQLDLYNPEQSKMMPERVNRLLGRLQLDVKEYQLLQAMIAKMSNLSK